MAFSTNITTSLISAHHLIYLICKVVIFDMHPCQNLYMGSDKYMRYKDEAPSSRAPVIEILHA